MASSVPQNFGHPELLEDFIVVPKPTNTTTLCAVCHKSSPDKRCGVCKNIKYCSPSCQTSDWTIHKTLCKPFVKSLTLRPSSVYRRALYFPADQTRPHFIHLAYGDDGTPLNIQAAFENTPRNDIKTISFHNRYLPYWIQISYDSNPAGKRALANNTTVGYAFRGPIVALAYDPVAGLSKPALDVDTTILGPLIEYAKLRAEYEGPVFVEQPQIRYDKEALVKIMGRRAK